MSSPPILNYQNCLAAMRRSGLPFTPTEAHAIAYGLLSAAVADPDASWHQAVCAELDPADALTAECCEQLQTVYLLASDQAQAADFALQLLVPEGDEAARVHALRDWAQGFLFGFGLGGEAAHAGLSEEGREALQDFYGIAQLDVEAGLDEQDAQDMVEVEEYMRVAAMLIFEDTHANTSLGEADERS